MTRKWLLTAALCLGLGLPAASADAAGGKQKPVAKTRSTKSSRSKRKPNTRGKARTSKALRRAVGKRSNNKLSLSQLSAQIRVGSASKVVRDYAAKHGWTKADRTGARTHDIAIRSAEASYRGKDGKLVRVSLRPSDFRSRAPTMELDLAGLPPKTTVNVKMVVVASKDGLRSFMKPPKEPLTFSFETP